MKALDKGHLCRLGFMGFMAVLMMTTVSVKDSGLVPDFPVGNKKCGFAFVKPFTLLYNA